MRLHGKTAHRVSLLRLKGGWMICHDEADARAFSERWGGVPRLTQCRGKATRLRPNPEGVWIVEFEKQPTDDKKENTDA